MSALREGYTCNDLTMCCRSLCQPPGFVSFLCGFKHQPPLFLGLDDNSHKSPELPFSGPQPHVCGEPFLRALAEVQNTCETQQMAFTAHLQQEDSYTAAVPVPGL